MARRIRGIYSRNLLGVVGSTEHFSFVPFRLGLLLPLQQLRPCGIRWAQSVATLDSINPISAVPPPIGLPPSKGKNGMEEGAEWLVRSLMTQYVVLSSESPIRQWSGGRSSQRHTMMGKCCGSSGKNRSRQLRDLGIFTNESTYAINITIS